MPTTELSPRLMAVASFVGNGSAVADIGTDHAYLPIYLCKHGIAKWAVASDVVEGPILSAKRNIAALGMSDKILCRLSNGLLSLGDLEFDTVCVCGMGGELIYDIINTPLVIERKPTLILQPMSSVVDLCHLLSVGGFEITDDIWVREGMRLYRVIKAFHTGIAYTLSPLEEHIGKINLQRRDAETLSAIRALFGTTEKIVMSKSGSTSSCVAEQKLLCEIGDYLKGGK